MPSDTDRLERQIVIDAPRDRVWRAITDVQQFNQWFGIALTGPFEPGAAVQGNLASPRYAHVTLTLWIETVEPQDRFAFRWHPHAIDPAIDYSNEPTTLVTFTLDDVPEGTRLTVVESGFDRIPAARRELAFTSNGNGWTAQGKNLKRFVEEALAVT